MRPPVFRFPTRDARDADHLAIIAAAGGIYLLWGRTAFAAATAPWTAGIAAASILAGLLLWLRVPASKWLGVLVFLAICGLAIRRCLVQGWRLALIIGVLLPLVCAYWMARIDYSHTFDDDKD